MVTGCRFPASSQFVQNVFDDKNLNKEWKLKNGSRIALSGDKGKEKIEVSGPEKMEWTLDEENQQIVFGDKAKKNRVLLDGDAGKVLITSEQIKGKSTVQIKGQELGLTGSGSVTLSGKGQVKIESKGPLKLSGTMIHLN